MSPVCKMLFVVLLITMYVSRRCIHKSSIVFPSDHTCRLRVHMHFIYLRVPLHIWLMHDYNSECLQNNESQCREDIARLQYHVATRPKYFPFLIIWKPDIMDYRRLEMEHRRCFKIYMTAPFVLREIKAISNEVLFDDLKHIRITIILHI